MKTANAREWLDLICVHWCPFAVSRVAVPGLDLSKQLQSRSVAKREGQDKKPRMHTNG